MALESLSVRHGVECKIREVLFSYYLKEHATNKGRYQLIARVGHVPNVIGLRTNDRNWKDMFLFVKGDLVWGSRGPGDVFGHWKTTSKKYFVQVLLRRLTLTFLFMQTMNTTIRCQVGL